MKTWLTSIKSKFATTLGIAVLLVITKGFAQEPFIPKYDAVKRSERCFSITLDQNNQFGAVWFKNRGNFDQDTTLYFVVYMGDKDDNGADGLAFVMHDDPRDTLLDTNQTVDIGGGGTFDLEAATGDDGGGLGYAMHESRVDNNSIPGPHPFYKDNHRIWPSVAIEIDTWNNGDVQDGNNGNGLPQSPYYGWDHTAVVYNGDIYNEQQTIEDENGNTDRILPVLPISKWGNDANIEDNSCYAFRIEWTVNSDGTQTLELYADYYNPDFAQSDYDYTLVMRHTDDMINGVFGGETNLRFGFTGSTGGSRNEQTICLLGGNTRPTAEDDYASTPVNTPVQVPVEDNDQDFDGDNLFIPIIVEQPSNGSASVISIGNDNLIEYTPNTNFTGTDTVKYKTCDVDSDKCYALCDTASAIISVGCGIIDIDASMTSPYTLCVDTLPADGAAEATFVSSSLKGTYWQETFSNMNGATSDNGSTAWSLNTNGGCDGGSVIEVQNSIFRAKKTGCEVVWETEDIDITNAYDIDLSIYLEAEGSMEDADYLEAYYILDGGSEVPLNNGVYVNNFGSATATATGLNADSTKSTLKIRIYAKNSGGDENYRWDDVTVNALGASSPPNITYNWYDGIPGSGGVSQVGTGQTISGLEDDTYYVVGLDQSTGCSSDTVAVTITSDPAEIDSIVIDNIAPLSKCTMPFDGELAASVVENGSTQTTTGYTFEWWESDFYLNGPPIRVGANATNLEAKTYRVRVTSQSTGCQESKSDTVSNSQLNPTVTPSVVSHIVSCDDPTGTISAIAKLDGVQMTSDVTFKWYNGTTAPSGQPSADYVGDTIPSLSAGDYAVRAVDDTTGCESSSANVTILDQRELPNPIITNATDQTSCDSGAPTGSFTAVVNNGGSNTTSDHTFNWYKGLNDVTPARPGYTGGPDVDSLEADQYRLVVENDTTGCTAILDTAIVENITTPVINNTATTDVTICGPGPNGTITVTPNGSINDFTYRVYSGNGVVPANLLMDTTSNAIDSLDIGNYTVTIVDKISKCESNPEFVSIGDSRVTPTANFTLFHQVSCDPGNPTGRIEASVTSGTANDYTFEWFENTIGGTPVATTGGTNGEIAQSLPVGTYALRITNNATQCQNTYFQNINNNITLPVIDTAFAVASTNCGTAANGELHATADGGQTDPAIFTFEWTDVSSGNLYSTGADTTNVVPGDYDLVVTNDTTTCQSNPKTVTVIDSTVIPDPVLLETNNSSCDVNLPNGQIEVTSITNEPNPLSDYTYEWFESDTTGAVITATTGPNGEIADSLSENTYALRITNDITTCQNVVFGSIIDTNIKPKINTVNVMQDALYCADPYQSHIEVTDVELIDGTPKNPSDFTYAWINLGSNDTLAETSHILLDDVAGGDEVPAGDYRVIAYNSFGCESDPVDAEVKDISVLPDFTLTTYNNTSCDNSSPNGVITVDNKGPEPGDAFDYEWENISTSTSPLTDTVYTSLGQRLEDQDAGDYGVTITDTTTFCSNTFLGSISDVNVAAPLFDTLRTADITICTPPNGEIVYQLDDLEQLPYDGSTNRTYTFYYSNNPGIDTASFVANASTDPTNSGEDSVKFTGLGVNTYYAIVRDEYTRCVSPVIETELIQRDMIDISVSKDNLPASCVGNDGEITVDASSPLNGGSGFDITINFHGTNFNDTTLVSQNSPVNSVNKIGLQAGFYSAKVEDLGTGCIASAIENLEPTQPPITRIDNSTPTVNCTPGNGTINFTLVDQGTGNPSDFIVHLYTGNLPIIANRIDSIQGSGGWDFPDTFTDLKEGEYYIITRSTIDGCFSNDTTVNIEYDGPEPDFSITQAADSTCAGAPSGQGSLDITISNNPDALYEYTWYTDADTIPGNDFSGPPASTTENNLSNGMYSVRILDNDGTTGGLGCRYKLNKQVKKYIRPMELALSSEPVDSCSSNSGAVLVDDILEDNISRFSDFSYDIELLDETNTTSLANTTSSAPVTFIHRGDSTFLVKATNSTTNCTSNPFQVTVDDATVDPGVNISVTSPDFLCGDPSVLTATGELLSTTSGGSTDDNEYSFVWYSGTDTSIPGNILPAPQYTAGTDPHIARELSAGKFLGQSDSVYTVLITDINDVNDGCVSERSISLPFKATKVKIQNPDLDITDQTICGPNGAITVNEVNEDFGSGFVGTGPDYNPTYRFQMLDKNLNVIGAPYSNIDITTGEYSDVPAGTYYIKAKNFQTGCDYGPPTQAIVRDRSNDPKINILLSQPDYACTGGISTGILSSNIFGGTDNDNVSGNFKYTWKDNNGVVVSNLDSADRLAIGTYTLEVQDDSGLDSLCIQTAKFDVTHEVQEIVIVSTTKTDQTWCNPNGTLEINGLIVNGSAINYGDPEFDEYSFDVFEGDLSTQFTPNGNDTGFPGDPYDSLSAETFFVVAVNDTTLCESIPRQEIVKDLTEDPIVNVSMDQPNYSLNYDNQNSLTGIMTVEAFEGDGSTKASQGYTYDWYRNEIDADSLVNNFTGDTNPHTVTNLRDAFYYFNVKSDSTGCETVASQLLPFEYLKPYFNPDVTDQTTCVPPNGEINIPSIRKVSDSTETFDKYRFSWYISEYVKNNPNSVKDGGLGGNMIQGLAADDYYVQALDTFWMVESDPVKVVLDDDTEDPKVNFNASASKPQTSCNANTPNGALSVTVTGFDTYDYAWYAGDTPSGTVLSTTNTLTDQPAGTYTVSVTSQSTGCTTVKTYNIVDDIRIPIVAESTEPVTNCPPSLANGIASANVINVNSSYEFYWYEGAEVKNQADVVDAANGPGVVKTNSTLKNVQPGFYTVVALDTFDCKSDPVTIEVKKEVVFPNITVEELAPLTYCDPEKPNAIFSARANGKKTGYTFEWFVKNDSLYASGPDVNNLGNAEYLLVATNNVTGCSSEMTVIPTEAYLNVPNPLVDIIRHRTSCIEPDGIAEGDINAKLENYQFNYLDDENFEFLDNPQNYTTVSELDINDYLVYAKDRVSGCLSDTVVFTINDARYTPDFDIISTPSLCTEPTGEAEAIIGDLTKPFQIEWYDDFGTRLGSGRELIYQEPGEYTVAVEGTDGCISEQDFTIGTEIKIYNGVSANGDNLNDVFNIVCLEYFPDNNVKIFNRAGELVYEMHDYDRQDPDKNFDGFANRGPIKGSGKLAIGTYYYIIDKGDGTEPKVGYLELTR